MRILNRIAGVPLPAYATQRTLDELAQRFDYAFKPWKPPGFFRPVLEPHPVCYGDNFTAAGLDLTVFEQDHGYMPSLGLRAGPFGYSTDVVTLDDAAFAALAGVETWVVGCFQRQAHTTHCQFGARARLGGTHRGAADHPDAYGVRHGLGVDAGAASGGRGAGGGRHGSGFSGRLTWWALS